MTCMDSKWRLEKHDHLFKEFLYIYTPANLQNQAEKYLYVWTWKFHPCACRVDMQ